MLFLQKISNGLFIERLFSKRPCCPSRGYTEGQKAKLRADCEKSFKLRHNEAHVQSNWEHMKPAMGYFDLFDHSGPAIGPNMWRGANSWKDERKAQMKEELNRKSCDVPQEASKPSLKPLTQLEDFSTVF